MTPGEEAEWRERLAAATAAAARKREDRARERAWFKARRDAGLRARHAAKLARNAATPGGDQGTAP